MAETTRIYTAEVTVITKGDTVSKEEGVSEGQIRCG